MPAKSPKQKSKKNTAATQKSKVSAKPKVAAKIKVKKATTTKSKSSISAKKTVKNKTNTSASRSKKPAKVAATKTVKKVPAKASAKANLVAVNVKDSQAAQKATTILPAQKNNAKKAPEIKKNVAKSPEARTEFTVSNTRKIAEQSAQSVDVKKPAEKRKKQMDVDVLDAPPKEKIVTGPRVRRVAEPQYWLDEPNPVAAPILKDIMGIPPYQLKDGEEYMNDRQISHFRQILLLWKQSLMESGDKIVSDLQDGATVLPDLNDRASQEEAFSLSLRTRDRERKLINKIDDTLEKLKNQDYGYCEACGIEIGIRRLEARPTANLCIDCKTLDEIRERQTGG